MSQHLWKGKSTSAIQTKVSIRILAPVENQKTPLELIQRCLWFLANMENAKSTSGMHTKVPRYPNTYIMTKKHLQNEHKGTYMSQHLQNRKKYLWSVYRGAYTQVITNYLHESAYRILKGQQHLCSEWRMHLCNQHAYKGAYI